MEENEFWLRFWAAAFGTLLVLAVLCFVYFTSTASCQDDCLDSATELPHYGRVLTESEFKLCLEKCNQTQPAQK